MIAFDAPIQVRGATAPRHLPWQDPSDYQVQGVNVWFQFLMRTAGSAFASGYKVVILAFDIPG